MPKTLREVFLPEVIAETFNDDPEFRIQARYWEGALEFGVDDRTYVLKMVDGRVAMAAEETGGTTATGKDEKRVRVTAPAKAWEVFLQTPHRRSTWITTTRPAPWLELSGDADTLWAYYPAIRRTSELLRGLAKEGEGR